MNAEEILNAVREKHPDHVVGAVLDALDPSIEVEAQAVADVCRTLRDEPALCFDTLHCISGVDYFQPDEKKAAKVDWQPHFEVLYHLSSLVHRHRIVIRVRTPRWQDDVEGRPPRVPSVCSVWRAADWHEREVYDLCGVDFTGHPGLCRILCPDDWRGHPLRKDYQPPDEYRGISAK